MDAKSKILIVDDDEVVRLSHRRSLTGADCSVAVAPGGAEALEAMARDPYDVVLLDLRMPGLDGMTVLKMIKEKWPDSEVVVITGYPTIESAKEAIRLGAYGYLAKPVGPDDVINAAQGAMTQKRWALRQDRDGSVPDTANA
jgi:DNA-binding NtrC family response regulator